MAKIKMPKLNVRKLRFPWQKPPPPPPPPPPRFGPKECAALLPLYFVALWLVKKVLSKRPELETRNPKKRQASNVLVSPGIKNPRQDADDSAPKAPGGWRTWNYGMQGRRPSMEDAHFVLNGAKIGDVLGVLDGCGGANASTFCSDAMQRYLVAEQPLTTEATVPLFEAFDAVERDCMAAATERKWVDATTATVAVVGDDALAVAWVGDSRCVLATKGAGKRVVAAALTKDHSPEDPDEKARIKGLGGGCGRNEKEAFASAGQVRRASSFGAHVVFNVNRKSSWRVFPGGIAITRALGARPLKTRKPPLIVAQPDLAKRTLNGAEAFLIVACDGVWDVFSDQQACDFVAGLLAKPSSANVAEQLAKQAHAKGSTDNISAVVLQFEKSSAAGPRAPLFDADRVDRYSAAGLSGAPETKEEA